MLKTILHKRFIRLNDMLSPVANYWYMCTKGSSVPVGIQEDKKYKRPEGIHL